MYTISKKELLINDEIREKEVRVIGAEGEQLGVMSSADAIRKAEEEELDLVLIAPQGNPPVCRIMNYGKYRFEQAKREKEARKNQKQAELKEIQMSLNIDTNDFNTKVNQAIKFLKGGDKVKLRVRFRRARELTHMNLGEDLMKKFVEACAEYGGTEKAAVLEGKNYMIVISPKPQTPAKKAKNADGDNSGEQ
ncbi:MAG: translation initiation factor IF-3 [Ruminiclostridium sp.]|nr:translation initiation factor IF-3 [Ruminiclostridium sp.]